MDLCFKPLEASDVEALRPYFSLRSNLTCDSVILDSFLWKDYYGCEFALVEGVKLSGSKCPFQLLSR